MAHLGLMLSRLALMVQAAVLDSQFFDPFSPFNDGGVTAEVGIGSVSPGGHSTLATTRRFLFHDPA